MANEWIVSIKTKRKIQHNQIVFCQKLFPVLQTDVSGRPETCFHVI
jgi:hypothetical protein